MKNPLTVVGLGEALFDCFTDEHIVLGGAPVNLAVHAHQLLQSRGRGVVVSAVGRDNLGSNLLAELAQRGMTTEYISVLDGYPTSTVEVEIDSTGETQYEIKQGVAWDHLDFQEKFAKLATECSAVCFGTLAQREEASRAAIRQFLTTAPSALKMCDVNLRQQFYSPEILQSSLELADVVKLNEKELPIVSEAIGMPPCSFVDEEALRLIAKHNLKLLALTRGEKGTVLYSAGERFEGTVPTYQRESNADSVGAGDSSCAAIIVGLLLDKPLPEIVNLANRVGAYVAAQPGATPALPEEILQQV